MAPGWLLDGFYVATSSSDIDRLREKQGRRRRRRRKK